ncbi:hypothetical protein B0T25DRAFT_32698 [Lasiosphaeria hispida]|uniref:Galactosyl transferase GMA12/MNN10 family protein n=1 Tax=Lasiosphaeria hispida TaxID=260671 RepID=A0AAJ0MJZ7_9PEZI|nr:hypothetical protein B0T25DRAFT_32698 [Lasiosphaeria hispida]
MLISIPRQRPARIASVFAVLGFLWFWLANIRDVHLTDDLFPGYRNSGNSPSPHKLSRVAKVTVAANKLDSAVIHRALLTHERHNVRHGYTHFIAGYQAVSGLIENDKHGRAKGAWTKPAYILSLLVAELEKPEDERLEWLFWFDADTVILNFETPLEVFLPPKNLSGVENVDLLITANWDGLNSGVFGLRVSPWSVSFISAVLAYPIYEESRLQSDRFRDQSAFQFLLGDKTSPLAETPMRGHDHWVEVPIRWFNSLPVNNAFMKNGTWLFGKNMSEPMFDNGTTTVFDDGQGGKIHPWKVMQGDMVVHFAGTSYVRDSWMEPWVERAEAELPQWNNATSQISLGKDVKDFWKKTNDQMVVDRAKSAIEEKKKEKLRKEKERKQKEEERKKKEEKDKLAKEKAERERLEKERKAQEDIKQKLHKEEVEKEKLEMLDGIAESSGEKNADPKTLGKDSVTSPTVPVPTPAPGFGQADAPSNGTYHHSNNNNIAIAR